MWNCTIVRTKKTHTIRTQKKTPARRSPNTQHYRIRVRSCAVQVQLLQWCVSSVRLRGIPCTRHISRTHVLFTQTAAATATAAVCQAPYPRRHATRRTRAYFSTCARSSLLLLFQRARASNWRRRNKILNVERARAGANLLWYILLERRLRDRGIVLREVSRGSNLRCGPSV